MPAQRPAQDDTRHLAAHLHFSPDQGHIQLFDQRMLLMHAGAFAQLRRDIVLALGTASARELLTRQGWQQGFEDGQRVRREVVHPTPEALAQALALGPRLREIEGFVFNQPVEAMQMDVNLGAFSGNYLWHDSWEAQAHLAHCGVSDQPACWTMAGYADGYTLAVTGVAVQWREVECVAMGHRCCRVVGRSVAEWEAHDRQALADGARPQPWPASRAHGDASFPSHAHAHDRAPAPEPLPGLVGRSPVMAQLARQVRTVAQTDCTVLLKGESGVGKERLAQALHRLSHRSAGPWVAINCAALPAELIESELFGVERGAFTGADRTRAGRFERAQGGTLFLDEVASLSLAAQGKLLRVLQEREVERVGGTHTLPVDVRIIAAANEDLREAVAQGRFREDLFFRLNVFPVHIPPLRERSGDLPELAAFFLAQSHQRHGLRNGQAANSLTPAALAALHDYGWPGNVRELENLIERAVIQAEPGQPIDTGLLFSDGEQLNGRLLAMGPRGDLVQAAEADASDPSARAQGLVDALLEERVSFEALERLLFDRAVERCAGNVSAAARLLGMGRGQVDYRMKKRVG
jgi:DNA-binding NtrC family response regulator